MKQTNDDLGFPQLTSDNGNNYPLPSGQPEADAKRLPFGLFGVASNQLDRALMLDDDDAFCHWLRECGGVGLDVFGHSSVSGYVKAKGGDKCQRAFIRMQKEALKA